MTTVKLLATANSKHFCPYCGRKYYFILEDTDYCQFCRLPDCRGDCFSIDTFIYQDSIETDRFANFFIAPHFGNVILDTFMEVIAENMNHFAERINQAIDVVLEYITEDEILDMAIRIFDIFELDI